MDINRFRKILNSSNSEESVNTDSFININIDSSEKTISEDVILKVLNSADVFNDERQTSPYYRLFGVINLTASNPLFNLFDSTNNDLYTWKGFNYVDINGDYRFFEPYYPNILKKYLKEKDGWFGYTEPDIYKASLCNFYDMEPKRSRFSFIPDNNPYNGVGIIKNWDLTITYPYSSDTTHFMVDNGLIIIEAIPVVVSERQMTAFALPCFHNLNVGDVVTLTNTVGYNGEHVVIKTGLENGDLKEYYFVLDLPPTGSLGNNSRMKKKFGGFESKYYFRLFKKVKTRYSDKIENDDYEIYNTAFSENSYNDVIFQYVFNEDINISGLTDNLGRPLSELYLTAIKTNSNNLFTQVKSGIETPFIPHINTSYINQHLLDIPVINKIHNGGSQPWLSHNPLEFNVTINNDVFYGDLVEYNELTLEETVLSDVAHRFNTINRETPKLVPTNLMTYAIESGVTTSVFLGPRQEGYYYKPHNLIKIRNFSDYVEQGVSGDTAGIPDYAVDLGDGRFIWRDILDIGYNENVLNYPFLNGSHYIFSNFCFKLKRQDPFDNWDLYYSKYPSDPIGDSMTNNFNINSTDDVC
jgi:hypothetical protein